MVNDLNLKYMYLLASSLPAKGLRSACSGEEQVVILGKRTQTLMMLHKNM